jgi:hypothetical protein
MCAHRNLEEQVVMASTPRASFSIPIQVNQLLLLCSLTDANSDKQRLSSLTQKGNDDPNSSSLRDRRAIERAIHNLNKCAAYCMNEIDCRRSQVLEYFGENFPPDRCQGTCDNCRRGSGKLHWEDFSDQACHILKVVNSLAEAKLPKLTVNILRSLFSTSKEKKLDRYRTALERIGLSSELTDSHGKSLTKPYCEKVLHGMVISEYLTEVSEMTASSFSAEYVCIGSQADALLSGLKRLSICVQSSKVPSSSRRKSSVVEVDDEEEPHQPLSDEVAPTIPKSSITKSYAGTIQSAAATLAPSRKPWEANKSGKLGLKSQSKGAGVISRGRSHVVMTESDDEDFDHGTLNKRNRTRDMDTVDLTSTLNHASTRMSRVDDILSPDSENISPEITMKMRARSRVGGIPDETSTSQGDEYVLNVKQRNSLRSWLNEYRKRSISPLEFTFSFLLDSLTHRQMGFVLELSQQQHSSGDDQKSPLVNRSLDEYRWHW